MMNLRTLTVLLVFYFSGAICVCTDKNALFSVKAKVHWHRRYKGEHVADSFNMLENYTVIDVYQATVMDLCEGMVKNFPQLETLSFTGLNILKIQPNAFQNVPKLRELSLSVNSLTEIPKGSFNNLPSLEILYLSANKISYIEENAFADMLNLTAVHLDGNKITSIKGNWFTGSPKIQVIDFKFNLIEKVTKEDFKDITPKDSKPISILLNKNRITEIDALEFDMPNPVNLHLEGNQINRFSNAFHNLQEKSKLYLNENQISCVPDDVLDNLRSTTKELYLLNNPIACSCLKRVHDVLDYYGNLQLYFSTTCNCFPGNGGSSC